MNKEELKKYIEELTPDWKLCVLSTYAVIAKADEPQNKYHKLISTEVMGQKFVKNIMEKLIEKFVNEDFLLKGLDDVADNQENTYFKLEKNENFTGIDFLLDAADMSNGELPNFKMPIKDKDRLMGFVFKIGHNDKFIWIYQHTRPTSKIKIGNTIVLMPSEDEEKIKKVTKDMIKITNQIDIIIIKNVAYTSDIKLLEKSFSFDKFITKKSTAIVNTLKEMDFIVNSEKIEKFFDEDKTRLTNHKKLIKANQFPVIRMKPDELVSRVRVHKRYRDLFVIQDDKLVINKNRDVENLLKLLTDTYLTSEISQQEYETNIKDVVAD